MIDLFIQMEQNKHSFMLSLIVYTLYMQKSLKQERNCENDP